MGFTEDAIRLGYERTVYNTGGLKWPYMDAILKRWHEAGLHERNEIEAKDAPHIGKKKPAVSPGKTPEPVNL